MKGNKKDGGKWKKATALFESEESSVHREQHYPFLLLRLSSLSRAYFDAVLHIGTPL